MTEGEMPGEAAQKDVSPETEIARILIRALWEQEWSAAHPEGTVKERKAAWKAVRKEETSAKGKTFRRALQSLKAAGVQFILPEGYGEEA